MLIIDSDNIGFVHNCKAYTNGDCRSKLMGMELCYEAFFDARSSSTIVNSIGYLCCWVGILCLWYKNTIDFINF